jgi:hypothetical protein
MAKHTRTYPLEFRRQILELIRSGKTPTVIAQEFDLNRQTRGCSGRMCPARSAAKSESLATTYRSGAAALAIAALSCVMSPPKR